MSLRLTCCACGFVGDIEAFMAESAARTAIAESLRLCGPLGERVMGYLAFFRPGSGRAVTTARLQRLLHDLVEPIRQANLTRKGRSWPAPAEYWQMAFDQMQESRDRLQLPLTTHGYLFEIVIGIAAKAEARGEQRREADRQYAYTEVRQQDGPAPVSQARWRMPEGAREQLLGALRNKPKETPDASQ